MKYGNFVYRVVCKENNEFVIMQLFELDNVLYFISKMPSIPYGQSFERLKTNLDNFVNATKLPIINFKDIKE